MSNTLSLPQVVPPPPEMTSSPAAGRRTLKEWLAAVRRRSRGMWIGFGASVIVTILFAVFWPPTWRSTGVILIEQQEIPTEYVRAAVTSYADQRVQVITQRVMTSANLLSIIKKFDLYAWKRERYTREEVLKDMRDDIDIRMISADVVDPRQGRPTKATIAFSVSFDGATPEQAAGVANEMTSLFMRENLENRQRKAAESATFLESEAERIGQRVRELDRQLAAFKARHGEALPEFMQLNVQQSARLEEQDRDADVRIMALDQQIAYLDAQLAQTERDAPMYSDAGSRVLSSSQRLKMVRTQLASARAMYGSEHPDVQRLQQEMSGLESEAATADDGADLRRQLTDARAALAAARERYAPSHPDVRRAEATIAALERELDEMPAAVDPQPQGKADNPIYIQLDSQRQAAANERSALVAKKATLATRLQELESRLGHMPGVEKDYSNLVRDLQGEQLKYQDVRQKQMEAQLASNLESESKGEKFTLIEPPVEPQKRTSPDLLVLFWLGLAGSIAVAFGTMVVLESVDTRVRGRDDVISLLDVPPLAVVPWVITDEERRRRRFEAQLAAVSGVACVVLAAVLVHFLYRPLDVLWFATLRRLG